MGECQWVSFVKYGNGFGTPLSLATSWGGAMLGFRSVFTTRHKRSQLLPLVRQEFDQWISNSKGWDPAALRENRWTTVGDGVRGLLLRHQGQDSSTSIRVRIVETKSDGQWIIQLTVHVPSSKERSAWAWVDIESPDPDPEDPRSRPRLAGTPRFVAPILEIIDAWDGAARLATRPLIIRGEEVDEVFEALINKERRGVVFVAGSVDSLPFGPWVDLVAKLTRFTKGMASCYVLDGDATGLLNDRIGHTHGVLPGRLRTYRAQVRPDSTVDAMRHRVLSTERILEDSEHDRLARILASSAQLQALEQSLQPSVARVHRMLERIADDMLVNRLGDVGLGSEPLVPESRHSAGIDLRRGERRRQDSVDGQLGLLVDYLKAKFGFDELTVDRVDEIGHWVELGRSSREVQQDIAARLDQLQRELDEMQRAHEAVKWQLDDEQIENREAVDRLTRSEETVRALRCRLASVGQAEIAWTAEPSEEDVSRPESFDGLLSWLPRLVHVEFTGDPDRVADLDSVDTLGAWASKTWDALLVLEDYASAKADGSWNRDVHGFLENTPQGCHQWPTRRHARDESEDVRSNPAFRNARTFPVPSSVASDGRIFMAPHFKIAQFGMVSPRMHYYDDTARSGRIYVGYIGRHLPTGRTN